MPVTALRYRLFRVRRLLGLNGWPKRWLVAAVFVCTVPAIGNAAEPGDAVLDSSSGLIIDTDWELAKAHCGACHSYRLVTANRGDRDYWLTTLRWMQRTQNLWPIPPEQEGKLLDYLAANYSESEWGRRPPLSPTLLP